MGQLLFGNIATSTITSPISASSTSVTLASNANFPSPGVGQYFTMTFNDAATGLLEEVVWVTAVIGLTFTIARGQEGTTPLAWNAGDTASNYWTAGQAERCCLGQTYAGSPNTNVSGSVGVVGLSPPDVLWDTVGRQWWTCTVSGDAAGAAWVSVGSGRLIGVRVMTTSGTYTPSAGVNNAMITVVGGGGAAGSTNNTSAGQVSISAGGGSGGCVKKFISGVTAQSVTVGAGGTINIGGSGNSGTTSSFGSILVALGGGGGGGGTSGAVVSQSGGAGGGASGGDINLPGESGGSAYGGFSSSTNVFFPGSGGSNPLGFGGPGNISAIGMSGTGYGSGGGGTSINPSTTNLVGGAGAPGIVVIEEYS